MSRLAVITVLLALALAPAAHAQGNDFSPLPPAPTPAPTAVPTPTPVPSQDDNTGRDTLFIIGGGLVIAFIAMGWWVARDARRRLPKADRRAAQRLRDEGPHRHRQQAKARARARVKAQKAARRRNR